MADNASYWVVIPAAGIGTRMGVDKPKQYITINDKTIIEHTLDCFIQREEIEKITVAIAKTDTQWPTLTVARHEKIVAVEGGDERCLSVLNCLRALSDLADDDDWVLVHDAARPGLNQSAIDRLMINLHTHDVGGILAVPCRDTIKRADATGKIDKTLDRGSLWQAQTPQMFKYAKLLAAAEDALAKKIVVTDESMAMERLGYKPVLVQGHQENIKITHQDDLQYLQSYFDRVL